MMTRNLKSFWSSSATTWSGGDCDLICCEIRQETHDVKSFFFKANDSSQFKFTPGQFITLELNIKGETVNRSYTISSAPTQPHTLAITVKRKLGGLVSNWLHDNLKVGARIAAFGPHGEFTSTGFNERKYLFLSAGSGITPLMSMSRTFHELAENKDVTFIHSARSPDDIIFRKELDLIEFNQPNFHASFICEQLNPSDQQKSTEFSGRLNLNLLTQICPDFTHREVFTCGPAPYMESVRTLLKSTGFDMNHYHEESFSFDTLPNAPSTNTAANTTSEHSEDKALSFSVQFTKSERTINCQADHSILEAATSAGVRLPSACSKGLCGTCKSKLISGKVDMQHGGGIRQREIDQGMILICCSKPLSNLVIEK